ncbi:hypothetical protein [Pasteurella canis]|uniref:hypothetical protein n=1 Tax=Pasteurella canis TaxID=753 RepID=UPI00132304F3|nr:hypothetical protein [Pasteurella canis]MXN88617.1 hypothetical protein [Pasteurella canis]
MQYIDKILEDAQTGATLSYHEIININLDLINKVTNVTFACYVSVDTKKANKSAVTQIGISIPDQFPESTDNICEWILNTLVSPVGEDIVDPYRKVFIGGTVKKIEIN